LRPDWICVREHVHYCSGPLSHMRNGVDKTVWDFAMHARDLYVQKPSDFLTPNTDSRDYSPAVGHAVSWLQAAF
jgi:hypothetical protein